MKKMNLAVLLAVTGLYAVACSAVGVKVDVKALIGVSVCGDNSTCGINQTMNAPAFTCCGNPADQKITDLGTISADTNKKLAVPDKPKGRTLYSFKPSAGELAGETVYVGLELQARRPGTATADKDVLFVFRSVEGTPTDWGRAGILESDEGYPKELDFTFKADGNVVADINKDVTFKLGITKLGSQD